MMQVNCTLEPCDKEVSSDTSGGAWRRGDDIQASLDRSNFGTHGEGVELIISQTYSACFD